MLGFMATATPAPAPPGTPGIPGTPAQASRHLLTPSAPCRPMPPPLSQQRHSSAIGVAAMLSVLMYIIGVSSDGMITGEFCCLYQTGADFAAGCSFNRCVSNVTGFSMNIGLFDGN